MKFDQLQCGCAGAAGGYDGYFKHSAAAAASAASSSGKACCTVCHQLQLQSLAVTYVQSRIQSNVHHAVQCLTATCLELACVRAALRLFYCELNIHSPPGHSVMAIDAADDYDHGYGNNYNHEYGRGYYGDSYGNFHHSGSSAAAASSSGGGSAAAAAASSGKRHLLGDGYTYYGYHNYHDSSSASAAASASGGDASAAASAASSGNVWPLLHLLHLQVVRKEVLAAAFIHKTGFIVSAQGWWQAL